MIQKITISLLMVILASFSLHAEDSIQQEPAFSFCDILAYNHPVPKNENEKKWSFNVSGSYTRKTGNTDNIRTYYSSTLQYDNNITSFKLSGSGAYGKTSDIKDEDRGGVSMNFDRYLLWHLELFTYTASDYNRITELVHRNDSGAGLKLAFIRNNYIRMDISGAPTVQYEKYRYIDAIVDWRWSIRGRFEIFPFSDDFTVKYYTYYIQKINDMNNYRTIHDLYVYKKLAGIVGIKAGYRREYTTYTKEYLAQNPLVRHTDSTYYIQASITL